MENLSRKLIGEKGKALINIPIGPTEKYPEKVLQFGEGNFLRGFVDWMINTLNSKGLFEGNVVVVQPIKSGLVDKINDQGGAYTLILRGVQNGRIVDSREVITAISRGIDLYAHYDEYMKTAESDELRFIISNTTEAGISYNPEDSLQQEPPVSYPGKLTALLYRRFKAFGGNPEKGLIIIPCELIDRNGDNLKRIVLQLAEEWSLGEAFIKWVREANHFLNTLVDRIVTGYPREEVPTLEEELGYRDGLLDTGEIFHLWVIEGDSRLAGEIPFTKAGLNVVWTDNMKPYRDRKVRILNGAHTMTVLAAYLYGLDTVKECMDDKLISTYMKKGIFDEIIPTLDLKEEELVKFAHDVLERFSNPFIKHYLLSISLNSVSKFKARVLPSLLEYIERKGKLPEILTFSLASLIAFYKGKDIKDNYLSGERKGEEYKICDDMHILETFRDCWENFNGTGKEVDTIVARILSKSDWWGSDLNKVPGLPEKVAEQVYSITANGIEAAIKKLL